MSYEIEAEEMLSAMSLAQFFSFSLGKGPQSHVSFLRSSGKFPVTSKDTGSDWGQCDDARRIYEEAIRQISDSGALGGRDIAVIWRESRNYWTSLQAKGLIPAKHTPQR